MSIKIPSTNLFQQQAAQQLNELCLIISDKWPKTNQNGALDLKSIIDLYTELFTNRSEQDQEKEKEQEAAYRTFYLNQLPSIEKCNQLVERLKDTVNSFESLLNRFLSIQKCLNGLIEMKVDIFDDRDADLGYFKQMLDRIVEAYKSEFKLKTEIVENFLFRSRFDRTSQIAILSLWNHEPYLNDIELTKFTSLIKFYFNKL
jgi:hypothetical protein